MTILAKSDDTWSLQVLFDAGDVAASESEVCTEALAHSYCSAALHAQNLLDLQAVGEIELSIQIVAADVMQALNLQYRRMDSATNVLSFESGLPVMALDDDAPQGGLLALGDLVFCRDVVIREAAEQSKPAWAHWAHLLVHGTLHLCGYDHEEAQQAERMESLEIQILSQSGIADPYGRSEYS